MAGGEGLRQPVPTPAGRLSPRALIARLPGSMFLPARALAGPEADTLTKAARTPA